MQVVIHEAALEQIDGEGPHEEFEFLPDPDFAVRVVDFVDGVEAAEVSLLDTAVMDVVDADFRLWHGDGAIQGWHNEFLLGRIMPCVPMFLILLAYRLM